MCRPALLALVAILPLAACGGGAGSGSGAAAGVQPRGYVQVMAEADTMRGALSGQREVGRSQLPVTGTGTYGGYLTLASSGLPSAVVGDMTLLVDFDRNDTIGLAGNFVGADGQAYDGRLRGRGTLTGTQVASAATPLAGTLTADGVSYALDLATRGEFLAPDGALIEGTATTRRGVNGADVTAAMILALD